LLLNRPSAQPQRSHGAIRDASRWQRHHQHYWQAVYSPTLSFSIRQFASRHTKSQRRFFPASDYNSIDDLLKDSINFLNSGGSMQAAAAVWARASRLLADRQRHQVTDNPQLEKLVEELFNQTMDSLDYMKPKDLATVILSMSKIAKVVKEAQGRRKLNSYHRAFGKVLLIGNSEPMKNVFDFLAIAADRILKDSDARSLSNLAYAYALVGYNPQLDSRTLLGKIGDVSVGFIRDFTEQGIANMVWAFATLNVQHPALFQTVGDRIDDLDDLESFKPQAPANIVWAYATLGIAHHAMFEKVGDHINQLNNLKAFKPQELSNTVWAYATLGIAHHAMFEKVGDHINQLNNLKAPRAFKHCVGICNDWRATFCSV
jgi:hypothetical protein